MSSLQLLKSTYEYYILIYIASKCPFLLLKVPITLIGKIYVDDSKIIAMQRCNEQVLLVDFFRYKKPCSIEIHVNFD